MELQYIFIILFFSNYLFFLNIFIIFSFIDIFLKKKSRYLNLMFILLNIYY